MAKELHTENLVPKLCTVVLVDTLGAPYYSTGHLPNAINVPPHQVHDLAPTLIPDRGAEIVVYGSDSSSTNAHIVLAQLTDLGYVNLWLYLDGLEGWIAAGLPVEPTA